MNKLVPSPKILIPNTTHFPFCFVRIYRGKSKYHIVVLSVILGKLFCRRFLLRCSLSILYKFVTVSMYQFFLVVWQNIMKPKVTHNAIHTKVYLTYTI